MRIALTSLVFFASFGSTAFGQAFPNSNLLENGATYRIVSVHSGKCLDVKDHSLANGGQIQQWDCHGNANQKFVASVTYKSGFILKAVESGLPLQIAGGSLNNGAKLIQGNGAYGNAGYFFVRPTAEGGIFTITANHTGKCLDVSNVSGSNGALIQQWDCHGNANQAWAIVKEN